MKLTDLEAALYHIRVNHLGNDAENASVIFHSCNGTDIQIIVYDDTTGIWLYQNSLSAILLEIMRLQRKMLDDLSSEIEN